MKKIVGVLLPMPLNNVFDYSTETEVNRGDIVCVPFGKEHCVGVVFKTSPSSDLEPQKIKTIKKIFALPPLKPQMLEFIEWVAKYNLAPLGLTLKMVLCAKGVFDDPKMQTFYKLTGKTLAEAKLKNSDARWQVIDLLKHAPYTKAEIMAGTGVGAGVVNTLIKAQILEPFLKPLSTEDEPQAHFSATKKVVLTKEQQAAADILCAKCFEGFSVTLLDGVTGSGKTEVYLEAAQKVLEQGKQVLILVPEIALTTQWLKRFETRFGIKPAEWHSSVSATQRTQTWKAVAENKAKVLIGARSALFLPYADLGLIVVDESHDQTFKQEDAVNYQARDMAVVRAKIEQIPIVLATATPDLETLVNVEEGKYDCVCLKNRYAGALLPEIKVLDLKKDKPQKGDFGTSWLAPTLCNALKENLEKGEQSVLFLNRRGYAPLMICRDCGHKIECPHCSAWLTEHRQTGQLICHHCGYFVPTPKACPQCGSAQGLTACGPGVERVAEEVKFRFPTAKVEVLSSDTTTSFKEISAVIERMENKETDILIGTQILAKGHHFPLLTLVGIVDADLGLMGSDLRASEQTYQLLSQVSGRAGRAGKKGTVYLQTVYPENMVLKALVENNRDKFIGYEKKTRQILNLPPYGKLASVIITSDKQALAEKAAYQMAKNAPQGEGVFVLGPAPAPMFMLRGKYRYRLLLKTFKTINIQMLMKKWLSMFDFPASVRVEADIDPYSFM